MRIKWKALMPVVATSRYFTARDDGLGVFVVETSCLSLFAFKANGSTHAEELVRSGWLTQALDGFCLAKRMASPPNGILRTANEGEPANQTASPVDKRSGRANEPED